MRTLLLLTTLVLLSACETTVETKAEIIRVDPRPICHDVYNPDGILGTTLVQTERGHRDIVCGVWGEEGDMIMGYWNEQYANPDYNGFSLTR